MSGATFSEVWSKTLEGRCAVPYCHDSGGNGWSGANKAAAHRTLVGVDSKSCAGQKRVVAGSPEKSLLVSAIAHTSLEGCKVPAMPAGKPMLAQTEIDQVVSWIRAGAQDN